MALKSRAWMAGGIGLLIVVSFGLYASQVDSGNLNNLAVVGGAIGLMLTLGWLWLDRSAIGHFLSARGTRQSGAGILLVIIASALALGANIVASKHDVRWDLTSSKKFEISQQTVTVLKALEHPVEVRAFFVGESIEKSAFLDLMDGYKAHTQQLTVVSIDPVLNPLAADQNQVDSQLGTVILVSGEKTQRLESDIQEEAVTNAIIRLTSNVEHTICSTEGHGELDVDDDMNPASISSAVTKLERQNYTFKNVNLQRAGGVPSECDMLLIAAPRIDFLSTERNHLLEYNSKGGQMLVLLEPGMAPGLAVHMAQYGIDVGENLVLENNPNYQVMGGDASTLVISQSQMTDHPITEPIVGMVLMRVARTVQSLQPPLDGFDVGELLLTSDYAWGETQIDGTTIPQPDAGQDPMGRLGLAAVSVAPSGGRTVVFGDSDFTSNALLDQASNFDLLPNAIAWLVGEEDQISIRPNLAARGSFTMNGIQGLLVWIFSALLIPALTIGGAIATWLARRKQ